MTDKVTDIKEAAAARAPQPVAEQPQIIKMPETPEQLQAFIGATVTEILNNPLNATMISQLVFNTLGGALAQQRERLSREMTRPILVRTEYPGSIKAVVVKPEDSDVLDVVLTVRETEIYDNAPEWIGLETKVAPQQLQVFRTMVLSTTCQPGDVYFITTSKEVDEAIEKAAQAYHGQMQAQQQFSEAQAQPEASPEQGQ